MISQPSFSLPSSGVPPHSSQTQHFLEDSNDYTINFAQMEGIADALLRQQFPDPGLQSPSIFNPATLLESSPSTQPSNAAKKVALEAFLPKSLIFPVTDSAQSPACPSVEMLMEESAVNLRITAKKHSKKAVSEADRNHFIALQGQWEKVLAINAIKRSISMDMVESIL